MKKQLPALAVSLAIVFAAAVLGGIGSREAPVLYAQFRLPPWAPPAGVFGPVWTLLYTMMGVAAWLVWRTPGRHTAALTLYAVQLAVNVAWSWFFFAARNGVLASMDVVLMLALVAATTVAFWRVRPLAGALLLPYLAWVSFATALTIVVWQLNPGML